MCTAAFSGLLVMALASPSATEAAFDVSHFSVAPSTTQARGHPNISVSITFADPNAGVKDIALHLPAGLSASRSAIPFCPRKRLLADLCPARSKVGSITIVGQAFGFDLALTRKIYSVRPAASEWLRLAVPIFGTYSKPGLAAELPVTVRPDDRGLDMSVTGLPREVGGIAVRVKAVSFRLRGVATSKVKKRLRRRSFLTNPPSCTPATSVLEITSQEVPARVISRLSSFTPTGCRSAQLEMLDRGVFSEAGEIGIPLLGKGPYAFFRLFRTDE